MSVGWSKLWNLHIPPKVKVFFWQAWSNILPTADLLILKRVPCTPFCKLCNSSNESIFHLFVECDFAVNCWSKVMNVAPREHNPHFGDWVSQNFKHMSDDSCCLLIMNCWSIWNTRNEKCWNGKTTPSMAFSVNESSSFLHN